MAGNRVRSAARWGAALLGAGLVSVAIGSQADAKVACTGPELTKPGTLVVAYNGDMPGTGLKDGRLVGIDGQLMTWVAGQLGLKVEPALMEWSAEIGSVQARRVDIMHGMMGWTKARTEAIAISDPIYYSGTLITQKKGTNWSKLSELKGKTIATIQGFGWIPELKTLDANLKLYDTSDAAVRDLVAGRIDALFADPPLIQWVQKNNPNWAIHSVPVSDPYDPKRPTLTAKYMIVFGLSKAAPKLEKCVNEAIAEMWKQCENLKVAKEYGFGDRFWFTPPAQDPRIGVDRPKGWSYPTLGKSCAK